GSSPPGRAADALRDEGGGHLPERSRRRADRVLWGRRPPAHPGDRRAEVGESGGVVRAAPATPRAGPYWLLAPRINWYSLPLPRYWRLGIPSASITACSASSTGTFFTLMSRMRCR